MYQSTYKENEEQRFPYILPVLRSYKQSIVFENSYSNSYEFDLPEIEPRWLPVSSTSMKKKNSKKRGKKSTISPPKIVSNYKYSPHFNVKRGSSKLSSISNKKNQ